MVHRRLTLVKQAIPLVVFVASIYRSIHHSIDYCAQVFFLVSKHHLSALIFMVD